MHKVFIDNKPLIFDMSDREVVHNPNLGLMQQKEFDFDNCLNQLKGERFGLVVVTASIDKVWQKFCSKFELLEAAGGLVKNADNKLLMIYRFNKWDLPKGKIEKKEKPQEAALREVCEETGVCNLQIVNDNPIVMYHTYSHKGKSILKKTYWYHMECHNFKEFKLQKEEDVQDAKWMNRREVDLALSNSYTSITDLIQANSVLS